MAVPCFRRFASLFIFALPSLCSLGCVGAPPTSLSGLNPLRWREWAEDERYGPTPAERYAALQELAERGSRQPPEEQERLARQLAAQWEGETDPLFRAAMVKAAGGLSGAGAALDVLRRGAADPEAFVRIAACDAWRRRGGAEAVQVLGRLLGGDTDLDVRLAAAEALGQFRDSAAVSALGLALDDPDPALRRQAIASLREVTGVDLGDDLAAWRRLARQGGPVAAPQPSLAERLRRWF